MAIVASQSEWLADTVAKRTAELLCTAVFVVDERGVVVASSDQAMLGRRRDMPLPEAQVPYLRVPIRLAEQTGEVVVVEPTNGEVISPRLARVLVELVINQTAVVERLPDQHELKNKFILDLLCGRIGDAADVLREGQILGMDLTRPRAVILIDAANYILAPPGPARANGGEARARRRVQLVIASVVNFFNLPDDTICAYIGDGEIAVLKASSTQDLARWADEEPAAFAGSWANLAALKRASAALLSRLQHDLATPVSIGIGRFHPGVHGLTRSYQDARAALSLGRRLHGQGRVHCLDGLGIAAFVGLADERTKVELAHHLLSPLESEPELIETLEGFFREECCPSTTAARLCIHRNTLAYRLDKISSLTGLDPRRFHQAMQIRLALLLRSLHSTER